MSDTQRCEPPEHLRGVDGWHWVEAPSIKMQFVRRWWRARGEWCWADMDERSLRSFRYLAPVTPPATGAALVEALEAADQFIRNGIELGFIRMPDAATPDPALKTPAKIEAALALYRGEAGR